jgi:predicted phosphodiesterase
LKILVISDLHEFDRAELSVIQNTESDFIVSLGDVSCTDMKNIRTAADNRKIYGVYGNHDEHYPDDLITGIGGIGIERKANSGGGKIAFAGIGGSHAYNGDTV